MEKNQRKNKVSTIAAVIILLSILLMIVVMPGIYTRSLPNENNLGALIGISLAIIFRLILFFWYVSIIKKSKRDGKQRVSGYILIGIFLFILGVIYTDGAFAFLNKKNISYVSPLMFTSVVFDLIASVLTFIAIFIDRKKGVKKSVLSEVPAWTLSLLVFIFSLPLSITTYIPGFELAGMTFYCIVIAIACYLICRKYPESVWYTLLICNAQGILGIIKMTLITIINPDNVPEQIISVNRWIFWGCCFLLSIIGAIIGAKIGRRKTIRAE